MKNNESQVAVIGGATIDIFGTATTAIKAADSNIGTVNYSFGGVGRNIAHNLSKLDINVELVCALGNDDNATKIIEHCQQENIGLNHILRTDKPTATYLSVNQPSGDIYVAIAAMNINDELTTEFLTSHLPWLNTCDIVVFDTNLSEATLAFLMANIKTKIFVDPVSGIKAEKLQGNLKNITAIKPNYIEALALSGKILSEEEILTELLTYDIKEVYLTLGDKGLLCGDKDHRYKLANYPGAIINTTGCGDAFLAGVIYGELQAADLLTKSKYGLASAAICCRSDSAINEFLSCDELMKVVG